MSERRRYQTFNCFRRTVSILKVSLANLCHAVMLNRPESDELDIPEDD